MVARRTSRPRELVVTPRDVELLSALEATGSIVDASDRVGITRDTGMYRLRRLARGAQQAVVVSVRGGAGRGGTTLTDTGRRILRRGVGPLRMWEGPGDTVHVNLLRGTWQSTPQPHVTLSNGVPLVVTFAARDGEPVHVAIEPEAIVVARAQFESSARNVFPGTVDEVRRVDALRSLLHVRVGDDVWLDAAVTPRSVRQLGLAKGARVFLYLKATAVTRLS